jgi:hypothetical protein
MRLAMLAVGEALCVTIVACSIYGIGLVKGWWGKMCGTDFVLGMAVGICLSVVFRLIWLWIFVWK